MENYCNNQACSHIKIICRCITVPSGKIRHTFIFHSPSSIFNYYPADAKTTRENLGWFSLFSRFMGIPPEKSIFSSFGEVVYGFSRPPGQLTESNSPYFFKKQSSFNYLSLSASFTLSQKLLRLT